jgi:CRISPR-associated protein Cas1
MGKTLYVLSSGELKRKENTIIIEGSEGRKFIPVETTDEMLIFGEVDLNKRFLEFCTANKVMLHFFNHYGYYQGTFYPREHMNSGAVILAQAKHCLDNCRRLLIAKKFVTGAIENMKKALQYYSRRGNIELDSIIEKLTVFSNYAKEQIGISELMGIEGNARDCYYTAFDLITGGGSFSMKKRSRRPPQNRINALISFLNSMCYVTTLAQIYKTHIDPRIGFLHETNFRRFSLNLDIAEIFKPIIVDRLIFSLLNKKEIQAKHFGAQSGGGIYLSEKGRPIVLKAWEERLNSTIEHPRLKRNVSYRSLIRMEAYKIEKHILHDEEYQPFAMRW